MTIRSAIAILVGHKNGLLMADRDELIEAGRLVILAHPKVEWVQDRFGVWKLVLA